MDFYKNLKNVQVVWEAQGLSRAGMTGNFIKEKKKKSGRFYFPQESGAQEEGTGGLIFILMGKGGQIFILE